MNRRGASAADEVTKEEEYVGGALGKAALKLEGIPEANTPVLICRKGVRASKIFLT